MQILVVVAYILHIYDPTREGKGRIVGYGSGSVNLFRYTNACDAGRVTLSRTKINGLKRLFRRSNIVPTIYLSIFTRNWKFDNTVYIIFYLIYTIAISFENRN